MYLFMVGKSEAAEMFKSLDESSTSEASHLVSEAQDDAIICRIGNVLSVGFQFF